MNSEKCQMGLKEPFKRKVVIVCVNLLHNMLALWLPPKAAVSTGKRFEQNSCHLILVDKGFPQQTADQQLMAPV